MAHEARGAVSSPDRSGVRLAELVGALSLAVDLGLGQPLDHVARSCLVARRLWDRMGLPAEQRVSLYYITLLGWVGCIADSRDAARFFGDDIDYRAGVYDVDMKPLPFLGYLLQRAGSGGSTARRLGVSAMLIGTGARAVQDSLRGHCQVTAGIARGLGLGSEVCEPLELIFARWDGKGLPKGVGGSAVPTTVQLWQLADVASAHFSRGGVDASIEVVRRRSDTQFAPGVVEAFCDCAADLFDQVEDEAILDRIIEDEPALLPALSASGLDAALEVIADYADLKSPHFGGHSRGVAELCAVTAARLGFDEERSRLLRRAALVHDLGRTGVPNTIWDKPGRLTGPEWERVRLHSYYTARMLDRPADLRAIGSVAALAHERLDGSGYHRGLSGAAIGRTGRVLAAADAFHAMRESRPYRAALPSGTAAAALREQAQEGRLDREAVDAVLAVSGQPGIGRRSAGPAGPAGLTAREVEVLTLLARGGSNRQIARRLGIATKTASNHIERIYAKAGVGTRAAATLFAMQHGLLDSLDPIG